MAVFVVVSTLFLTILMAVFGVITWKEGHRYTAAFNFATSGVNLFAFTIALYQ